MKSPYVFPGLTRGWQPTLDDLLRATCNHFNVTAEELRSKSRSHGKGGHSHNDGRPDVISPRQAISYIGRNMAGCSDEDIGRLVNRDRTTIIHSFRACRDRLSVDADFRRAVAPLFARYGVPMPEPLKGLGKK